ncbi:MAG: septal ring lytic transglycosylase RlpA family protein [Cyanobacteria bacterium P01_C01_bin.70]
MEILGIVWAASILHPASTAAKSTNNVHTPSAQQQESSLMHDDSWWLRSLQTAYGWVTPWQPLTSEVINEDLSPTEDADKAVSNEFKSMTHDESFQALVPVIGSALTSFEPAAELTAEVSVNGDLAPQNLVINPTDSDWHNWSTVAAVRLEPATTTPAADLATSANHACLQISSTPHQPEASASTSAAKNQVWVHNRFIGEVSGEAASQKIAARLRALVQSDELNPSHLMPIVGNNFVGISHQNDILFVVDEALRSHPEVPAALTAVEWVNNLRAAFDEAPMNMADIQMAIAGLTTTSKTLHGVASWYGPWFHGKQTANGEIFDENALTAAHKTLPFNTHLKVTNRINGKSVVVRINDRGPYIGQRSLDLSKAAAQCLGSTTQGVVPYEAVILEPTDRPELDELTTAQLLSD